MNMQDDVVIVTGSSGYIGRALVEMLAQRFRVVGLDHKQAPKLPPSASFLPIDLTSDDSVREAFARILAEHGDRIASVLHLAAYFDLTGEPNPNYEAITIGGTERLLRALKNFQVEQFVFFSTMLVHAATKPGYRIDETTYLDPKLPYRASKAQTELVIQGQRASMPVVYLRPAGVYDDLCHSPFIARQIARIYERSTKGHVYPGDLRTGQSFLHLDDLTDAVLRLIDRRKDLPPELPLLVGEEDLMSYGELQREIGRLAHGEEWETWEIPKSLAKAGAWLEDEVLGEEPFIRPWMIDIADDHYALDISQARRLLHWQPQRSLRETLPKMIAALKADPVGWYKANRLNPARVVGKAAEMAEDPHEHMDAAQHRAMMREHKDHMQRMHLSMLWPHMLNIGFGAWLATSPFVFGTFNEETFPESVLRVTEERGLWAPALRSELTAWSDVISGLLMVLFGTLSLSSRLSWAQWANTAVGLWLLFAPLVFWTPSAAVYANDTLVGALVIAFAILVPMMPGMSHEGMMDECDTPPGWTYSPSSYLQRIPIIALGLIGFIIARVLAAYQLGHIEGVWEPFFSGGNGENGTEFIITSDVSKAWPIADGGLGAVTYMLEVLMGVMGDRRRWRTMPWMVLLFGIVVVPLGVVSIYFIIIQPIVIGTYCTLCLAAAIAMLVMIPFALDELVAMGQFLVANTRRGRPLWRSFFMGDALPASSRDKSPGFGASLGRTIASAARGVNLPWTLLASVLLGAWLMFSRMVFGTDPPMAHSDHLVGALVITTAAIAMAEVARPIRFINVAFGLWLIIAPWLLAGESALAWVHSVLAGAVLIALSLPRGTRSKEHYGGWDRYIV